jgi:hypothetical protein
MSIDWNAYLANNSDLGAAGLTTAEQAEQHYNTFGQNEGRQVTNTPTGGLNSFTAPNYLEPVPVSQPYLIPSTNYQFGNADMGYGNLSGDQYSNLMSLSSQDAYNKARTDYGMSGDQIADLWNRNNPSSTISASDLYSQFNPGLQQHLVSNNLGYSTYDNGEGVGKALPGNAYTPLLGYVSTYDPNPVRLVSAPPGSVVAGPTPSSSDGLYHFSDGTTSTTPNPKSPPTQQPIPQGPPTPSVPPFTPPEIPSTPTSGDRWREALASGMGDQATIYELIMEALNSGMSLSAIERDYRLNPGQSKALWDSAFKYAQDKGLPVPYLPSSSEVDAPYYQYGFGPGENLFTRDVGDGKKVVNPIADYLQQIYKARTPLAKGGRVEGFGGLGQIKLDPVIKRYVGGRGGGQQDNVPASLSPGEYVFDADAVAALGDGNSEEGARKLDQMRQNIRTHKRAAPSDKIPPKAKRPEQYLKGK